MVRNFSKYTYPEIYRDQSTGTRLYKTPEDSLVPSVTTILSKTKDMLFLEKWKQRVGKENARKITQEAASIGTSMHLYLESHILNEYWLPVFNPLLSKLNVPLKTVWRVKANLYPRTQWRVHHKSHVDYYHHEEISLTTCLYYLNDSNRVTIFDGKKKVKAKGNRAIFFDGTNRHHSTTPTDANCGISFNIDYNKS